MSFINEKEFEDESFCFSKFLSSFLLFFSTFFSIVLEYVKNGFFTFFWEFDFFFDDVFVKQKFDVWFLLKKIFSFFDMNKFFIFEESSFIIFVFTV